MGRVANTVGRWNVSTISGRLVGLGARGLLIAGIIASVTEKVILLKEIEFHSFTLSNGSTTAQLFIN